MMMRHIETRSYDCQQRTNACRDVPDRSSPRRRRSGNSGLIRRGFSGLRQILRRRNRCQKPVTFSGDCLNELGIHGIVAEEMAELADGGVDAVLGVDEDFAGPETLGDFGAGNELALARDKEDEQLHRLALDAYRFAVSEEFETSAIEAKVAEFKDRTGHFIGHGSGQRTLLRGGNTKQCVRKSWDLKGVGALPKLHLRLYHLFIA